MGIGRSGMEKYRGRGEKQGEKWEVGVIERERQLKR